MANTMATEITLTRGYVTVIDNEDRTITDDRTWHAHLVPHRNTVYACTKINSRHTLLHRLLADWAEVDHADGDGLNNRRSNLRDGTGLRNKANKGLQANSTSGFKGVSRRGAKWGAFIKVNRKQVYLGLFGTPEDAAAAYDRAAVRYFGEYARTNLMLGKG
jgi:AP2 domain